MAASRHGDTPTQNETVRTEQAPHTLLPVDVNLAPNSRTEHSHRGSGNSRRCVCVLTQGSSWRKQDQTEWQIEWQMALVKAYLRLADAGLCSCSGWPGAPTCGNRTCRRSMVRRGLRFDSVRGLQVVNAFRTWNRVPPPSGWHLSGTRCIEKAFVTRRLSRWSVERFLLVNRSWLNPAPGRSALWRAPYAARRRPRPRAHQAPADPRVLLGKTALSRTKSRFRSARSAPADLAVRRAACIDMDPGTRRWTWDDMRPAGYGRPKPSWQVLADTPVHP